MLAVVADMEFITRLGAASDHTFLSSEILYSSLSHMAAYISLMSDCVCTL